MKRLLPILLFCLIESLSFAQNFGLQFDGDASAVTLCHDDNFNIGDGFTIEAWILAADWKAEAWRGSIVNKDGSQGPGSGFAFRAGDNGTLSFVMSAGGAWNEVQTDPFMNLNQWYHVAAVVDDANVMSLYVNGALMASAAYTGAPTPNTVPLTIGASPGFPGRFWNGNIDEVRVWNIARTPQQIDDNQTTDFTGSEPGLVAYLPMNDGMSLSVSNVVDNACSGNFVAMGEDAWVEGYSIPAIDVGVFSINAPDVLSVFERPVKVNVTVQNYGSETVSNFPIVLDVNGLPTLEENFTGSLAPGETAEFTFTQPLDLTDNNTNLLNAKTSNPDDPNAINNAASYRYKKPDDGNILSLLNEERHDFGSAGQTQFTLLNLPENMEDYEQLLLHFSLECPNGGCDPWDQPASFYIDTEAGETYEIARFITPYGIECGPWTVDVTDFKSIMRGTVNLRSFIQVWGPSGWLINADLEFVKGDTPIYQELNSLWESDYIVYGDPGISHDLPMRSIDIDATTYSSHMRMTISGHGQGNTDNAAEFSNKTHIVNVNGSTAMMHNLWKADCAQNSCSGQGGNWQPNRAGWCPGQNVTPLVMSLNGDMNPGSALTIDYILEDYVNLMNTDYNDSDHTEPHYRLHSFLIEQSEDWYIDYNNLRAESIEVGTNGDPGNPVYESLTFKIKNTGSENISGARVAYFINGDFVFEETISETINAGASYTHEFSQINGFTGGEDHLVYGVVIGADDENLSDDVADTFIDDQLTDIDEVLNAAFKVFPNPSAEIFNIELTEQFLNGQLNISDAQGKIISSKMIEETAFDFSIATKGVYILSIITTEGQRVYRKLIVQ